MLWAEDRLHVFRAVESDDGPEHGGSESMCSPRHPRRSLYTLLFSPSSPFKLKFELPFRASIADLGWYR
jgi:hypothetical protein